MLYRLLKSLLGGIFGRGPGVFVVPMESVKPGVSKKPVKPEVSVVSHENEDDFDDECEDEEFELDDDDKRIVQILSDGEKPLREPPAVGRRHLEKYHAFLSKTLPKGLRLTGMESNGYFIWEERFEFGHGSKSEYKKLHKKKASYHDQFKYVQLTAIEAHAGSIAQVLRTSDNQTFHIPLADLEASDEKDKHAKDVEIYSMWVASF